MAKNEFRVPAGKKFRLADHDPAYTGKLDKPEGEKRLEKARERMHELQEKLFAQDEWALLVVFQAMDGAGKDSTIEHVMSGLNPAGCQVFSFKAPSAEELDHDFLWRTSRCLPERGRIGVFNRSYYEEVLVVRVHPEYPRGREAARGAWSRTASGRSASRTSTPSSATSPGRASRSSSSS